MNLAECTKIISKIAPMFASFRATDDAYRSYHKFFEHLPAEKFEAALRLAIENSESGFFPTADKVAASAKRLPQDPSENKDTHVTTDFKEGYRKMQDSFGLGCWYGISSAGRKISGYSKKENLGEPIRHEVVGATEFLVYRMPE